MKNGTTDLATKLRNAQQAAEYMGVGGYLSHLAHRAVGAVPGNEVMRLFIVVLTEPRPPAAATEAARNHTFRFATIEDLEALTGEPDSNILERDVRSFKEGNRCLLQYDGENLVGYSWISASPLIELAWGVHFNLPDDMVYNYNGFTTPKYRGTAYQALRHLKLLETIRGEGKRRLMGYVDHLNYRSLRGVEKSGYERVGVLRGVRRNGKVHFSLSVDEASWSTAQRAGPVQR